MSNIYSDDRGYINLGDWYHVLRDFFRNLAVYLQGDESLKDPILARAEKVDEIRGDNSDYPLFSPGLHDKLEKWKNGDRQAWAKLLLVISTHNSTLYYRFKEFSPFGEYDILAAMVDGEIQGDLKFLLRGKSGSASIFWFKNVEII